MKKILIIHPEGNITNNPGLSSIVELLSEYYEVYILQPKKVSIYQDVKWNNVYPIFYRTTQWAFLNRIVLKRKVYELIKENYYFIIGVDEGIEHAGMIAKKRKIPLGLISYEILFPKTLMQRLNKKREISACKDIAFAICQDSMRSYLLSLENHIPIEKIINIPISESYNGPYKKSSFLKEKLNIPQEKKIVLYIGSLADWTLTDKLFNATTNWPEPWVLVIHPRYGIDDYLKQFIKMIDNNPKIFLSAEPVHQIDELEKIICSADIGLALYTYDVMSPFTYENLLFIGLSSGKIATYLKYGIPVIVNNDTNVAEIVSNHELGKVIDNLEDISLIFFNDEYLEQIKGKCKDFFLDYLDFSLYKKTLLSLIENVNNSENIVQIIKTNNQLFNLKTFTSMRMYKIYSDMKRISKDPTYTILFRRIKNKIRRIFTSRELKR